MLDLLSSVSLNYGVKVEVGCRCSKTRCLKLYCDCFQRGKICVDSCSCRFCLNTPEESGPDGIRTKTIRDILRRRPDAFQKRVKKVDAGCACKKSRCLKKYCDCFRVGKKCTSKCICTECLNGIHPPPECMNAQTESVSLTTIDQPECRDVAIKLENPFHSILPPTCTDVSIEVCKQNTGILVADV